MENKEYPDFKPPNANIEREKAKADLSARNIGAVIGGIIGFAFEFISEWQIVETSDNSIVWLGNFFVFAIAAVICAAIGAGIGALISWEIGASNSMRKSEAKKRENKSAKEKWESDIAQEKKIDAETTADFQSGSLPISELKAVCERMLYEYYSDGPIYRKYQSLPAVCQLYEYFDSGRFSELGEAYNQYELEVRLDRLIDNSEQALQALHAIQNNQHLLYDALVEVRSDTDLISRNIDKCFDTVNRMAYSQEVSSICLQQTALATTLLSQMKFYKDRHDLPLPFHIYEGALVGINARLLSQARSLK